MLNERSLRELCNTSDGPYLRPFAANARWRQSRVFLVGTNPATPLRDEFSCFDEYWNALTVDVSRFEEPYAAKHRGGVSRSTRRARKLLQQLRPLDVLVTNAMIYPASCPGDIPDKSRQRRIGLKCFDFLVRLCNPKVILFYGSKATRLGSMYFGVNLNPYLRLSDQITKARGISLFAFPHFSGQGVPKGYRVSEMDQELALFARRAKEMLGAA